MTLLWEIIDEEKTLEKVKKKLERYRIVKFMASEDHMPRITSNYTLEMPKTRSVETVVTRKVDIERDYLAFFNSLKKGIDRLNTLHRKIILMSYFEDEPNFNYRIAMDLNMSDRTFYRHQRKALLSLALALKIAVFKKEEEGVNEIS